MENNIIKKLRDNIPISNNNKSNFWVDRLKPIVSEDIYQVSGYGPYTPKHIIKSWLHRLGQRYLFGADYFKLDLYKEYKKIFDKYDREIDYHVAKHIVWIEKIKEYIKTSNNICIIGDSKLNFMLGAHILNPNAKFFMINLPEVLITDYLVVKKMNLIEDNKIEVVDNISMEEKNKNIKLYLIPASEENFV